MFSIIIQAVLSILGVLTSAAVTVAIKYINSKRDAVIAKIGAEQYNADYIIAKNVYFAVEQLFKGATDAAQDKRQKFEELLLKQIPGLTQSEIDHFRESVVGEINSQINSSNILNPAK